MLSRSCFLAAAGVMAGIAAASAQVRQPAPRSPTAPPPSASAAASPAGAPAQAASDSLSVYFASGSAGLSAQADRVLDKAAETYREGKPIIMVVSGGTDSSGAAAANLVLSQQRADNVVHGLVARGIPVECFQILAKGETEPAVPAPAGTSDAQNRRVEISWR